MKREPKFRVTLGQLMAATAFFGVVFAASSSERWFTPGRGLLQWFFEPRFLVSGLIRFVAVGVCLANLRLSRALWLVIIGQIGPWITPIATILAYDLGTFPTGGLWSSAIAVLGRASFSTFSALEVVGLALTFREIRRKLGTAERFLQTGELDHPSAQRAAGLSTDSAGNPFHQASHAPASGPSARPDSDSSDATASRA